MIKYLGDIFGNTSKNRTRSEIIVFIRPKVIRNALDAQGVAEEFRERLETMRGPSPVIEGRDVEAPKPQPQEYARTVKTSKGRPHNCPATPHRMKGGDLLNTEHWWPGLLGQ